MIFKFLSSHPHRLTIPHLAASSSITTFGQVSLRQKEKKRETLEGDDARRWKSQREKKKNPPFSSVTSRVSDSGYSSTEPRTGCGRMEKGWCKLIRMQKEMPRGGSAGDARTARKKGRKDNEYDVNFKADWGRSNHRRRGSATPNPNTPPGSSLSPRVSRYTHGLWTLTLSE